MSKSSKLKTKEENRKKKRASRDAMRAQYQAWADAGTNSKRGRKKSASANKRKIRTRQPTHSNVGCMVSHPGHGMEHLIRMKLLERCGIKGQFTSKYSGLVNAEIERRNQLDAW